MAVAGASCSVRSGSSHRQQSQPELECAIPSSRVPTPRPASTDRRAKLRVIKIPRIAQETDLALILMLALDLACLLSSEVGIASRLSFQSQIQVTSDRHRSHHDLGLRRRQFQPETGIAVSQFHCQTGIAALSAPEFHTGIRADRAISVFRPEREPLQSCKPGRLRFQRGLHSLQRCFR